MALATQYRSRLDPRPTGKELVLTPRDDMWFERLHRHGALPSTYLLKYAELLGYTCDTYSLLRLGELFNEGYLIRPRQQTNQQLRYRSLVYDLKKLALDVIGTKDKHREFAPAHAQSMWWHHDFMLSTITASIELACLAQSEEYEYIFHDEICEAMDHALSFNVTYDDQDGKERGALLKPDRAFGIRYLKRQEVRYFLLEADRGTETVRSKNVGRKRLIDNYLQYRQFIGAGDYRDAMNYEGGVVLLSVFTRQARLQALMEDLKPNNYMAFVCLPGFDPDREFVVPDPMLNLFSDGWHRVDRPIGSIAKGFQ